MTTLSPIEKYELTTRNLQEVLGGEALKKRFEDGQEVRCYWGTAPTGRPHIGYFTPLAKIADFLTAGVTVKILLADLHAFLDSQKAPLALVAHRVKYYQFLLVAVFKAIGVPTEKLEFVVGSDYQLSKEYTMDVYRLSSISTDDNARRAGAEVVKQSKSAPLSSLLYPGLQALDEQYLDVDFQFGGVDQRKIFIYAEKFLPELGYTKRSHLMNAIVPGLVKGGKMSSSDPKSKIDFLDSAADVKKKINTAFCEEGNIEENGVLSFFKAVAIPIAQLKMASASGAGVSPFASEDAPGGTVLSVERYKKDTIHVTTYQALEDAFAAKEIHPADLKPSMTKVLNAILQPIREAFDASPEFRAAEAAAYPVEAAPEKKTKAPKKPAAPKGDDAQAAEPSAVAAQPDATGLVAPIDALSVSETKAE